MKEPVTWGERQQERERATEYGECLKEKGSEREREREREKESVCS